MRLRASEWLLLVYFSYVAILPSFFPARPHLGQGPVYALGLAAFLIVMLAAAERRYPIFNKIRDWSPLAFTLGAFLEMDWFTPAGYRLGWERAWLHQDHWLLMRMGLARALEAMGPVVPAYLELCYLLAYSTGAFCVLTLWLVHRRAVVDRWMVVYLTGTLLAYALFPYFPTMPPRALEHSSVAVTWLRRCNLWLLDSATIHSAVFPSAHVSSAFSASWGLFVALPRRRAFAWGMLFYACSVSVATVYGRYHYAADVAAGFAVSLVAVAVALGVRAGAASVATAGERRHPQPTFSGAVSAEPE